MIDYRDLAVEPPADFVDRLERLLLTDLAGADDAPPPRSVELATGETVERTRSPRRTATWLVAAAAAVVLLLTAVVVTRDGAPDGPPTTVPATAPTTVPPTVTTTVPTTTSPAPDTPSANSFPVNGFNDAGTYDVGSFTVPFTYTTSGTWHRDRMGAQVFSLSRGGGPTLAITTGLFAGNDARDVVDRMCPGAVDASEPVPTSLLGAPATQVTVAVIGPCDIDFGLAGTEHVDTGVTLQVTASDVGGTHVVVVVGALMPVWTASADEVAELLASLTPLDPSS